MTPFVFDTLSASKQLREAGMPEGVAEAVVSVFQHAATTPDISHLATKVDVEAVRVEMATRADMTKLKAELDVFSAEVRAEFATVRAEINEKVRQQTFAMLGGTAVLITVATAVGRLIG